MPIIWSASSCPLEAADAGSRGTDARPARLQPQGGSCAHRCIDKAGGLDRYILSEPKSEATSHVAAELRALLQVPHASAFLA